jgi:hypothetical protein
VREQNGGHERQDRNGFDPVELGALVCSNGCWSRPDFSGLPHEVIVPVPRKMKRIVCTLSTGRTRIRVGMLAAIQWHVVGRLCVPRDTCSADLAKPARAVPVKALHVHHHRNCGHVPDDKEELSTKMEVLLSAAIARKYTELQLEKLLNERPEKQVEVFQLLRTRDNTTRQHVLLMESNIGREVVIEE